MYKEKNYNFYKVDLLFFSEKLSMQHINYHVYIIQHIYELCCFASL